MSEAVGWKSPFEFRKVDGVWQRRRIGDTQWSNLVLQPVGRKRSPRPPTQKWTWR